MSKTTFKYKDIAPGAAEAAKFQSGDVTASSVLDNLRRENESLRVATLEQNLWLLDGSFDLYDGQTVPLWSTDLSGADCSFEVPPVLEISLPDQYSSLGLTLVFDSGAGNFCSELNIKWYQKDDLKADADFSPDTNRYFCHQRVEAYDRIVITFKKTWLPYRYVKLQQVIFGIYRTFGMTEIRNAKITNQVNHISAEVPISTLDLALDSRDDIDFMFQLKQPFEALNDDFLIGVYYINEHRRTARTVYDLRCQDAIGVLNDDTFSGGVYTNYSAKQLMLDIIGNDFKVDFGNVEDMQLTGILQPSAKRAAIQQVAFAWGVCVATDGGEVVRVFHLEYDPEDIGTNRVYTGATVQTSAIVTSVRVTAHTYTQSGNGSIEIGGVKYEDTGTVYTVTNPGVTANDKQNVVEITGATLVSPSIGQVTAQRVYDFYTKRDSANAKIVWKGELLGDCVTVPNSWGSPSTGNISRMDITLSNTVAAQLEVIA